MLILTPPISLTGAALGGVIVRPLPLVLALHAQPPSVGLIRVIRLALWPPVEDEPRHIPPTLVTVRSISPRTA